MDIPMKKFYYIIYTILLILGFSLLIYVFLYDGKDNSRQYTSSYNALRWTDYNVDYHADSTVLTGTLSVVYNTKNFVNFIGFYSVHQNIMVYCNDAIIYQFPVENNNPFAKSSGYNWNFITLPPGDNQLRIEITSPYDSYLETIPTFYVGNSMSVFGSVISDHILTFVICIIIFGLGACLVAYWVYTRLNLVIQPNLLQLGLFAILLSIWSINESRFTTLLFKNNLVCSYISFISLILLPLPFSLFVRSYYNDKSKMWDAFCIIDVIQIATCVTLQLLKIADFRETLLSTHVMMLLLAIIIVISSIRMLRRGDNNQQVMLHFICISVCVVLLAIDLIAYYLGAWDNNSFGRIGFLFYIIVLGLASFQESASLMKLGKKADVYHQLAFTDQMTSVSNRTAFNNDFEILSASPHNIAIINFDLNNLKKVNDTLGHLYGDKYITTSAKIISDTYSNVGKCYRVGGDEFVVIIEQASTFDFPYYFNLLEWHVDSFNKKEDTLHIQIAYGFAIYDANLDKNLDDTYSRADENMYINKIQKKKSRS